MGEKKNMAYLFKFNERYQKELYSVEEKLSNEEKNFYQSLFRYEEKSFLNVIGEESYQQMKMQIQDIISSEISLYKECKIYDYICLKFRDYFKYYDFSNLKEYEIKYLRNQMFDGSYTIILNSRYTALELKMKDIIMELVRGWSDNAQNKRKNSRLREKKILLCCVKDIEGIKGEFLERFKIRKRSDEEMLLIDVCFTFLCAKIFPDIQFWKMKFDKRGIEQKVYDDMLNLIIKGRFNSDKDTLWKYKERKQLEKLLLMICSEEEVLYEIEWYCSEKGEDLFRKNFQRYSFCRCFSAVYRRYFGGEEDIRNLLNIQSYRETRYRDSIDWEKDIRISFLRWSSIDHLEDFCQSTLKETLFCILNGETLKKDMAKTVIYDTKNGYWLKNEREVENNKIWCMGKEGDEGKEYVLRKLFSLEYQIVKAGTGEKTKKPMVLIDRVLNEMNATEYFESYMLEMQQGVLTAWKLYSIIFELANFEKNNADLNSAISRLAKNIGNIHNLELRLYVLEALKPIFNDVRNNRYVSMVESVNYISKIIATEADKFNSKYDKMVSILLWLYKNEENWKDILWMRNIENKQFSELLSEVQDLQEKRNGNKSYSQMKFLSIYKEQEKAKGRTYVLYDKILAELKGKCSSDKKWLYM